MNPCIASISAEVLEGVDALGIQEAIDQSGFWLSPTVIDPDTCAALSGLWSEALFRSTVSMARYGFGRGEYKYFARPWNVRLGRPADWPAEDFDGGELLLVEQRPRKQSRPRVIPMVQGAIAVIPVKERPSQSMRGVSRIQVRHGVSEVRRGLRRTLGVIFHDAA